MTVAARRLSESERAALWSGRLHVREAVSRSFVFVPGIYVIVAAAIGIVLPAIDRSSGDHSWLHLSASGTEALMESVAAGMVTFSCLVVSVAVPVVQFGASRYSPRLVQSFRRDAVVKNALGLFVTPGLYALVAAADIGGAASHCVGTLTVIFALALIVAGLIALFGFIGRLLDLLRPRPIYARLLRQFTLALDRMYPASLGHQSQRRSIPPLAVGDRIVYRRRAAVLVGVDRARLVAAARRIDSLFELTAPIGSYVAGGTPILLRRGEARIDRSARRGALIFADGHRHLRIPRLGSAAQAALARQRETLERSLQRIYPAPTSCALP